MKILSLFLCGLIFVFSLYFLNGVNFLSFETINVNSNAALKKGDIDNNGLVNDNDLQLLEKEILTHLFLDIAIAKNCDVNGDGDYDLEDIIYIKKILCGDVKPGGSNSGYTPPTPKD